MLPSRSIVLRSFRLEDAVEVASLVGDEAVSKWTSSIPHPYCEQDAIDWINQSDNDSPRRPLAVEVDGRLAGCVSFWPYGSQGVEVGYWVGRDFWGQGICTEALGMLLASDIFPTHSDAYAKVMTKNEASRRVLEKCGFEFLEAGAITKNGVDIEAKTYVRMAAT